MHGIIILGGNGTRLNLFTRRVNNKALALVHDRLVFEYPLNTLVKAGIKDITVVLGGRYSGSIASVIGDGKEFGVNKITYVYQNEPKGISHAIYQAKDTFKGNCAVILGDNFFEDDITKYVQDFEEKNGCRVFLSDVPDPERYGVAEIRVPPSEDEEDTVYVTNIIEKPKKPKTSLAVTGLYFYDQTLFDRIEKLKPSSRGELEVTDLNMMYVKENKCIAYDIEGYWNDMGTPDSILDTGIFVRSRKFELNYKIDAWK